MIESSHEQVVAHLANCPFLSCIIFSLYHGLLLQWFTLPIYSGRVQCQSQTSVDRLFPKTSAPNSHYVQTLSVSQLRPQAFPTQYTTVTEKKNMWLMRRRCGRVYRYRARVTPSTTVP